MTSTVTAVDDTEVVDLEKMLDSDVTCTTTPCDRPAVWQVWCAARCGNDATLCSEHYAALRAEHPAGTVIGCARCGRTGTFTLLFNTRML